MINIENDFQLEIEETLLSLELTKEDLIDINIFKTIILTFEFFPERYWINCLNFLFFGINLNNSNFLSHEIFFQFCFNIKKNPFEELYRYVFRGIDLDKDGYLNYNEFNLIIKSLGFPNNNPDFENFFKIYSINNLICFHNYYYYLIGKKFFNENFILYPEIGLLNFEKKFLENKSKCCLLN